MEKGTKNGDNSMENVQNYCIYILTRFFLLFYILEALVDAKTTFQETIIVLIGNKNATFMLFYNSDGNYIVICL